MKRILAFTAVQIGITISQIAVASPIKVQVAFVEALAPKDTTSSERFQKECEASVAIAKTYSKSELAKCGYEDGWTMLLYVILLCDLSTKRKKLSIAHLRFTLNQLLFESKIKIRTETRRSSTTEQPVMRGYDLGHTLKLLIRSLVKVATHYTRRRAKEDFTPISSQG